MRCREDFSASSANPPDHFEAHYNLANVRTEHYKPYTHTSVQPVSVSVFIYFVSVGNALSAVTLLWQMSS